MVSNAESSVSRLQSVPVGVSPPPAPRTFFGHEELIEKVVGIAENLEPIALIGPEGIGKTAIALTVLHHHRIKERFGSNRRFIRCDRFPASVHYFLSHLSKVVGAGIESPEDMAPLRPLLSSKEMLIVLDNAESILGPQGTNHKEIYEMVDELCQFENICIFITSRLTTVPRYCTRPQIPTLSIEAARDIFYGIYGDHERSGIIDNILQGLDFHALSIALFATTASDNRWSHDRLAREWDVGHTRMLQTKHEQTLGATIESTLGSPTFHKLGPNARDLLEVVAFFPQGLYEKNLDWLFPIIPDINNIIDKFCALSLTYRSNSFITMLAQIRAHLYPQDPKSSLLLCATKDHYLARLPADLYPDGHGYGEAWWIQLEDVNIKHLLNVFTSVHSKNPADGGNSSVVSLMSQLLMFQAVPTSSSTNLITDASGSSPTESEPQTLVDGHEALIPEWKHLISRPLPTDKRASLIAAIFSDSSRTDVVKHLHGDDAQTFVDVIDEVLLLFHLTRAGSVT